MLLHQHFWLSADLSSSHPHIYGIDLAASTELVAYKRDRKAIAETINADDVIFLSLEDLVAACAELSSRPNQRFEVGVFCGRYVTPVSDGYLEKLEKNRTKPKAIEENHKAAFVPVGDRAPSHSVVAECSDLSLNNLAGDHALL
jgi:amidophosphoribosyltransferase